jgi:trans-aconitate methyltransferase
VTNAPIIQDVIFWQSEGDRYYRRNMHNFSPKFDVPMQLVPGHPQRILEIGCAHGPRLGALHEKYECECVGVEPSEEAVHAGKSLFPNVTFVRATAADIPLKDPFDLVIVHFVLHWISREKLLRSLAEIDRLTSKYLIIGDFMAEEPRKREYHHLKGQGVFTYKQNYAQFLVDSCLYKLEKQLIYPFYTTVKGKQVFDTDGSKGVCTLLKKEQTYIEERA